MDEKASSWMDISREEVVRHSNPPRMLLARVLGLLLAGCYGWVCIGRLHDPNNSDSISILGVVLTIWTWGFYVDTDGVIHNKS